MLQFLWSGISWMGPYIRAIRLGRAIEAAIMMIAAILTLSITRWIDARDPVIGYGTDVARVVKIATSQELNNALGSFVLANGDTLTFFVPQPLPQTGDHVPLKIAEHRSGKRAYSFDRAAWLENGPIYR